MRIEFRAAPLADLYDGAPVGRVIEGGRTGDLFYVGREPRVRWNDGSDDALEKTAFNEAVARAIEGEAATIWGDDWSRAVAELAGLNRRTTTRDRVGKHGLPAPVVLAIVNLARRDDAREMAGIARALARYWDVHSDLPPGAYAVRDALDTLEAFRGKSARPSN